MKSERGGTPHGQDTNTDGLKGTAPRVERPMLTKPPFLEKMLKTGHLGPSHLPQLLLATRAPRQRGRSSPSPTACSTSQSSPPS